MSSLETPQKLQDRTCYGVLDYSSIFNLSLAPTGGLVLTLVPEAGVNHVQTMYMVEEWLSKIINVLLPERGGMDAE